MAQLNNFPDQIQVKLGNAFQGGGNGLDEDDVLVLTKIVGPSETGWYEDSGSPNPNPSTNRLNFKVTAGGTSIPGWSYTMRVGVLVRLGRVGVWAPGLLQTHYRFIAPYTEPVYNFKDLWLGNTPTWVTGSNVSLRTQTANPSFVPTTGMTYNPNVLKELEEYVPSSRGPDKTTYRYG